MEDLMTASVPAFELGGLAAQAGGEAPAPTLAAAPADGEAKQHVPAAPADARQEQQPGSPGDGTDDSSTVAVPSNIAHAMDDGPELAALQEQRPHNGQPAAAHDAAAACSAMGIGAELGMAALTGAKRKREEGAGTGEKAVAAAAAAAPRDATAAAACAAEDAPAAEEANVAAVLLPAQLQAGAAPAPAEVEAPAATDMDAAAVMESCAPPQQQQPELAAQVEAVVEGGAAMHAAAAAAEQPGPAAQADDGYAAVDAPADQPAQAAAQAEGVDAMDALAAGVAEQPEPVPKNACDEGEDAMDVDMAAPAEQPEPLAPVAVQGEGSIVGTAADVAGPAEQPQPAPQATVKAESCEGTAAGGEAPAEQPGTAAAAATVVEAHADASRDVKAEPEAAAGDGDAQQDGEDGGEAADGAPRAQVKRKRKPKRGVLSMRKGARRRRTDAAAVAEAADGGGGGAVKSESEGEGAAEEAAAAAAPTTKRPRRASARAATADGSAAAAKPRRAATRRGAGAPRRGAGAGAAGKGRGRAAVRGAVATFSRPRRANAGTRRARGGESGDWVADWTDSEAEVGSRGEPQEQEQAEEAAVMEEVEVEEEQEEVEVLLGCRACRWDRAGCDVCKDDPLYERPKLRWRPELGRRQDDTPSAPTFYPTAEEFADPFAYIESIRAQAEPYGLCCIVPPPEFDPPFAIEAGSNGLPPEAFLFNIRKQPTSMLCHREADTPRQAAAPAPQQRTPRRTRRSTGKRRGAGRSRYGARRRVSLASLAGASDAEERQRGEGCEGEEEDDDTFGFTYLEEPQCFTQFAAIADWVKERHFAEPAPKGSPEERPCKRLRVYPGPPEGAPPGPSVPEIEAEFWRLVEDPDAEYVESLYGQDIDSGHVGSGFPLPDFRLKMLEERLAANRNASSSDATPTSDAGAGGGDGAHGSGAAGGSGAGGAGGGGDGGAEGGGAQYVRPADADDRSSYRYHPWNINNMPRSEGSVLRHVLGDELITGVMVPWLYIGSALSAFCWHVEDHAFCSINYMHMGAPKIWYGVPGVGSKALEDAMRDAVPHLFETQPNLMYQLVTTMSPTQLRARGVPVYRLVHHERSFVITFPNAYHGGFNTGFNCAEAVNFAPPDWLPWGSDILAKYRADAKPPTLSHDALLLGLVQAAAARGRPEPGAAAAAAGGADAVGAADGGAAGPAGAAAAGAAGGDVEQAQGQGQAQGQPEGGDEGAAAPDVPEPMDAQPAQQAEEAGAARDAAAAPAAAAQPQPAPGGAGAGAGAGAAGPAAPAGGAAPGAPPAGEAAAAAAAAAVPAGAGAAVAPRAEQHAAPAAEPEEPVLQAPAARRGSEGPATPPAEVEALRAAEQAGPRHTAADAPLPALQLAVGELALRIAEERRRREAGLAGVPGVEPQRMGGPKGRRHEEHGHLLNTEDVDCDVCKCDLWLSAVVSPSDPNRAVCPEHAAALGVGEGEPRVLLYRFTLEELQDLVGAATAALPGAAQAVERAQQRAARNAELAPRCTPVGPLRPVKRKRASGRRRPRAEGEQPVRRRASGTRRRRLTAEGGVAKRGGRRGAKRGAAAASAQDTPKKRRAYVRRGGAGRTGAGRTGTARTGARAAKKAAAEAAAAEVAAADAQAASGSEAAANEEMAADEHAMSHSDAVSEPSLGAGRGSDGAAAIEAASDMHESSDSGATAAAGAAAPDSSASDATDAVA